MPPPPFALAALLLIQQNIVLDWAVTHETVTLLNVCLKLNSVKRIKGLSEYASLDGLSRIDEIIGSWPGPNTWLLPAKDSVSSWVKGTHTSIAIRVSDHVICHSLCLEFGHPIVSTSANRHGHDALLNSDDVAREFSHELDFVLDAPVGASNSASTIRDAITGEKLR